MDKTLSVAGHNVSITPKPPDNGVVNKLVILEAAHRMQKYKQGLVNLHNRIVENEQWWKLQHWNIIKQAQPNKAKTPDIEPTSSWLFGALANKHADIMDNSPEPNILAREQDDEAEAKVLSSVIPVILDQAEFEQTYSDGNWYKLKNGTCPYMVLWDPEKLNGLGDIAINRVDLLNLFWEPGIKDIQDTPDLFFPHLVSADKLRQKYPNNTFNPRQQSVIKEYIHDESIDTSNKCLVVDWYYKKMVNGKTVLHYCVFSDDEILFASENDAKYINGWYAHGKYPIVFDVLFPEEDMPVGFGYIDIMKQSQMYIDKLDQIIMKNALLAGKKRWFASKSCGVNIEDYLDYSKDIIETTSTFDNGKLMEIPVSSLDSFIITHKQMKIDEQKETSGNRDFNQGGSASGVTAASAIAALQEAGNKRSRDEIKGGYRAYKEINYFLIELDRQFYDLPRTFRIVGERGAVEYIQHSNEKLKMRVLPPTFDGGQEGYRLPMFDISVKPQRSSPFSKMANNEFAKELYQLGFFAPQNASPALGALNMMDFEGKQAVTDEISQNATLYNQLVQMQQLLAKLLGGGITQGAAPGEPTGKSPEGQTMDAATQNANTPYTKKVLDRSKPDMNKPQGVSA